MKKKEKCKIRYILLGAMFAALLLLIVFMRFGGFSTGEAANVDELQEYALPVETLSIPEEKRSSHWARQRTETLNSSD